MNTITVTGIKSRKSETHRGPLLGTPAISIPMPGGKAFPLRLQLTAEHGNEDRVLRTAVHLHNMLGRQRV